MTLPIDPVIAGLAIGVATLVWPFMWRRWRKLICPPLIEVSFSYGHGLEEGDHFLTTCPIDRQPRVFIVVEWNGTKIWAAHDTRTNRLRLRLCGRPTLPTA